MRQMRRINRQITDREKLRQIIEDCKVVRIGAMDAEGLFVLPVNYGYDLEGDRLTLYIHSAKEGRKAELFLEGAEVAFEMDRGHRLITPVRPQNPPRSAEIQRTGACIFVFSVL